MKMYCSECAKPIKKDNGVHMFTGYMRSQFVCNECYELHKKKENVQMKKTMKRLAITTMALFALLGAGGTIAYASGYITWAGTADYQQTLVNLGLIADRGDQLKTDKQNLIAEKETLLTEYEQLVSEHENTYRENEQLTNVIKDKENQINSLEQQIEALEKRIADGQTTRSMLEQAEKDAKHVREETESVLEGLE